MSAPTIEAPNDGMPRTEAEAIQDSREGEWKMPSRKGPPSPRPMDSVLEATLAAENSKIWTGFVELTLFKQNQDSLVVTNRLKQLMIMARRVDPTFSYEYLDGSGATVENPEELK